MNKEFPQGKENYCPKCYFGDEKVILRNDCKHCSFADRIMNQHIDMLKNQSNPVFNPKSKENWEEEFDIWFDSDKEDWDNYTLEQVEETRKEAKDFIRNLLSQQKAEIIEEESRPVNRSIQLIQQ